LLVDDKSKRDYLTHLAETVFIADVIERQKIRNKAELEELFKILASSIGSPCNPTKLSNTFKSGKNVTISNKTISNYINHLADAFLIEKALRYNIKGKKYINTLAKYYFTDIGLRNALLGFRQMEQTHIMENIIYNELIYRGYSVDVGVVEIVTSDNNGHSTRKQLEVDFVVNDSDQRYYIQSAYAIPDDEKMRQETASLRNIKDTFKRIIVVKDDITPYHNEQGYLIIGLFDFLISPKMPD
jgi:predicted AAA+ superfamily ATPase